MQKQLCFNNGKFRILQMSDLQDTKSTNPDTLKFIDGALNALKPDLVVLTGDQLDVFGFWGKGEENYRNVETAIKRLFSVFEKHNVPFVLTFGNHDRETGISNEEQAVIYSKIKNCICFDNLDDGRPDAGTYNVEILSTDKSHTALNLYVIDSGTKLKLGDYGCVDKSKVEWCVAKHKKLCEKNNGRVDSMVFQHIPVYEIYDLLKKVPKKTKGALPAYNSRRGEYYIRDNSKITFSGSFRETPASPGYNEGQLEKMRDECDVFAMFFGHDHYNSFAGKTDGVDLGYCPGTGFNPYGIMHRGMRVFDFDENDVKAYTTTVINYKDVCDKSYSNPIRNFAFSNIPSSPYDVPKFALKYGSLGLAVLAVLAVLFMFVSQALAIGIAVFAVAAVLVSVIVEYIKSKSDLKKILGDNERVTE